MSRSVSPYCGVSIPAITELVAGLLALVKAWVVVSFGEVEALNQYPCSAFISPHKLSLNMSFKRPFFFLYLILRWLTSSTGLTIIELYPLALKKVRYMLCPIAWFPYRCICRICRVCREKKIHRTDRIHSISYKKLYLSFLLY